MFDKTGTLTEGRVAVVDWEGAPDVLAAVASAEAGSAHAIAAAFRSFAGERSPAPRATEANEVLGSGVSALVDSHKVYVGKRAFVFAALDADCDQTLLDRAESLERRGLSPVFVAVDGEAGLAPDEKLAFIESASKRGRVFMVGDGVNDASAPKETAVLRHGTASTSWFPKEKTA